MHLEDAIWDSKAVSYDGIVRSAYRGYLQNGDSAQLYRSVNDYLSQIFSRESRYQAAFLRFWGDGEGTSAYVLCRGTTSFADAAPSKVSPVCHAGSSPAFQTANKTAFHSSELPFFLVSRKRSTE